MTLNKKITLVLSCALFASAFKASLVMAATLEDVRERGAVRCGVNSNLTGFATANSLGEYTGFDVDICRAVASAIFNDSEAVEMLAVSATDRFEAVRLNNIDILSRNTTWTMTRNALFGDFVGTSFYDGQAFMVSTRSGIRSALQVDNKPVCVRRGTTSEPNATDFFAVSDMRYRPVLFNDERLAFDAYLNDECEAITTDRSGLAAQRSSFDKPDAHLILPEVISKEPLGPMVASNDSDWANVVRWSLNCMINAEELGVNSQNIDDPDVASIPAIERLVGQSDEPLGTALDLDEQWCTRIIRQIGNYGEIYDRHIGENTPVGLPRGINALWTNGGLIHAPPIR